MPRPSRLGPYAPLSATYFQDDALAEAGEKAELLFCRGLAFCAQSMSDGFISDLQLTRFVAVGMRDARKRAQKLTEVGVWERVNGGYVVRGWLKWNKSAREIGAQQRRDRERKAGTGDAVRKRIYHRDGNRCRYCGATTDLCLDHVKPLSAGGTHDDSNLQTLCQPCNWRKSQRDATGMTPGEARDAFGIDYGIPTGMPQESRDGTARESSGIPVPRAGARPIHFTSLHTTPPQDTVSGGPPTGLGPTETLLAEYLSRCRKQPPAEIVEQLGRHTHALLAEGIAVTDVRNGIAAWAANGKSLPPSLLPSFVNDAMNATTATAAGGTATTKARGWLELAADTEAHNLRAIPGEAS